MSAAKHTPGPWTEHEPTKTMHAIRSANGRTVADVGYSGSLDGDKANARLIAAAPDLLDAIARLVREDADGHITIGCIEDARAALAKATGSEA